MRMGAVVFIIITERVGVVVGRGPARTRVVVDVGLQNDVGGTSLFENTRRLVEED
jgi:hypothetical protein